MEYHTYAESISPPTTLERAYDSGNQDHIYREVYRHAARKLARVGRDYTEGYIDAQDMAQNASISIMHQLDEQAFTGDAAAFVHWVNSIIRNKRLDYLREADERRKEHVELFRSDYGEDGSQGAEDNPKIYREAAFPSPCGKFVPSDTGVDPDILAVMCDEIRRVPMHRVKPSRSLPTVTGLDREILRLLSDELWDDDRPNYVPGSHRLDPDFPRGAYRTRTYAEIGAELGLSASAVKLRISRIRRKEAA